MDGILTWSNSVASGTYLAERSMDSLAEGWTGFLSGTITSAVSSVNVFTTTQILVDDFEGSGAPAPWVFYHGAEFPGATGSLSLTTGSTGHAARLTYDFTGGGRYVSAEYILPTALCAVAVTYQARSSPGIRAVLRVMDESWQMLQYNTPRPLWEPDPDAWCDHMVNLAVPDLYWGGSNDGILHGKITRICILAADPLETNAVGYLDFDKVRVLTHQVVNVDPFHMPVIPVSSSSSHLEPLLGVNIHFTDDDAALDAARAAGFSYIRMDLFWTIVETAPGVYDFSSYDHLLADLEAREMKALFILDYGNPLYTSSGLAPPTNATAIQAFGHFAEEAARHFAGRPVSFEIWNEPNIAQFWPPKPDALQYVALATVAVARVHAGNASAKVSTGGLSTMDCAFLRSCLAAGGGIGADAIGVHPYRSGSPESASDDVLAVRALVQEALPSNPPVWNTEWGYSSSWFGDGHSSAARTRQAVMAIRELLTAWSLGFPLIIYYDLRDDGTDPANAEHNFGLLANDYSNKPAMQAVCTLVRVAKDRELAGILPMAHDHLYALRLDGTNDMVVTMWARTADVKVFVPSAATGIDMFGQPLPLQSIGHQKTVMVTESGGPIYLTFPKH
jgi:hypothetical protein